MSNEALLIIDMLNDFVLPGAPLEVPENRNIIKHIRREIDAAHSAGRPVLYLCDAHASDDKEFARFKWPAHAVKGTRGARIVEELAPVPGDRVIEKTSYSSFLGTTLQETLETLGVNAVRLTGCVTHICILFTAYESVLRDYAVTVITDGVAGIAKEDHDAALRIMKNVLGARLAASGGEGRARKAA